MPTPQTVTIAGRVVTPNNVAESGQSVNVSVNQGILFYLQADGQYAAVHGTSFSVNTDGSGNWTITFLRPGSTDPPPIISITGPDKNVWVGTVPDVSGTVWQHDLKNPPYNWAINPGGTATLYTLIASAPSGSVTVADPVTSANKLAVDASGRSGVTVSDAVTPSRLLVVDSSGRTGHTLSDPLTPGNKLGIDSSGRPTVRPDAQVSSLQSFTGGTGASPTDITPGSGGYTSNAMPVDGLNGGLTITMLLKPATASDTATLTFQGSADGTNWATIGFAEYTSVPQPLATASLAGFGASGTTQVVRLFQINLSPLKLVRFVLGAVQSAGVSANWAGTLSATGLQLPI